MISAAPPGSPRLLTVCPMCLGAAIDNEVETTVEASPR